jgi:hypothetical protein
MAKAQWVWKLSGRATVFRHGSSLRVLERAEARFRSAALMPLPRNLTLGLSKN